MVPKEEKNIMGLDFSYEDHFCSLEEIVSCYENEVRTLRGVWINYTTMLVPQYSNTLNANVGCRILGGLCKNTMY